MLASALYPPRRIRVKLAVLMDSTDLTVINYLHNELGFEITINNVVETIIFLKLIRHIPFY